MEIKLWEILDEKQRQEALIRPAQSSEAKVHAITENIISRIRAEGDQALAEFSRTLDKYTGAPELTEEQQEEACRTLEPELKEAIGTACTNIRKFHEAQEPVHVRLETSPGIVCETRTHPIDSVGLYVPGGSAPLVSTALMLAVPAAVAGCPQVILCSPPPISAAIIYASRLAGVRRIFCLGGAQAIAAMAYGTQSVPKVKKIFGPGNQYVTMAKRLVSNDPAGAAIDMPAGPSEVLVIADAGASPEFVAADLLSQAEHGPDSQALLVTDSKDLAVRVLKALELELGELPRRAIAEQALSHSCVIVCRDLEEAAAIACAYAPEHLIVQTREPEKLLPSLRNAGSIFLGAYTPESLGDYASGTNHTLPTYGYAATASALGTDDFRRRYTVQCASADGLRAIGPAVKALAAAEGLEAHRRAVVVRAG